jgi:hypothetical protein
VALATAVYVSERVGTDHTFVEANGPYIVVPVFFPVLVAAIPLLLLKRWARVVSAVLMAVFVVIAGFSIGFYYAPAAFVMLLAACVGDSFGYRDAVPDTFMMTRSKPVTITEQK